MTHDATEEDFTVYDLATRMAGGQQLSTAAQREVAAELLRVRSMLRTVAAIGDGLSAQAMHQLVEKMI